MKNTIKDLREDYGKMPPQATDLEEAVLGALMLEKDAFAIVGDMLKPEVFYKDAHQRIFRAIQKLCINDEPVDLLTVSEALRQSGELEAVGGYPYLSQLTSRVASAVQQVIPRMRPTSRTRRGASPWGCDSWKSR